MEHAQIADISELCQRNILHKIFIHVQFYTFYYRHIILFLPRR